MINAKVVNAIIEKFRIERESKDKTILIRIDLILPNGAAFLNFHYSHLEDLFNVLEVDRFEDVRGKPCVALIADGYVRSIGNFLRGKDDYKPEEHWMGYSDWKEAINRIIAKEASDRDND